MTVAVVIDTEWEIEACLAWAGRFAIAREEPLLVVILAEKREGEPRAQELLSNETPSSALGHRVLDGIKAADSLTRETYKDPQATQAKIFEILGTDPSGTLLKQISESKVSLLILPRHTTERGADAYTPWELELMELAPCEVLQLNPSAENRDDRRVVLLPVDQKVPSQFALQLGRQYCEAFDLDLTALYVEPNVDEYARDVGRRIVRQVVLRALGSKEGVQFRVVLETSVKHGIVEAADEDCALLLMGAQRKGIRRRWLKQSITEHLLNRGEGPTVAILRPAVPLTSRVTARMSRWIKSKVPQLDREQRVSLVERIQGSSQWDFDFIALTCLSTLIAALGLVQDSPAVVIGAMLVAPLMTPLVGAGLSLVQGNRLLVRRAGSSVLRGFLVAFALALVTGWLIPNLEESREMLARGSPNVLDFLVAFISGSAAAYAIGRPNLLSALPGVAIAAALVPPIATAGMAASLGNFGLALGALLLFVTNIVAIVLGTAAALWAVGVRPTHEHGALDSWVVRLGSALVLLAAAIAGYEAIPKKSVPAEMTSQLRQTLSGSGVELSDVERIAEDRVRLQVRAAGPVEPLMSDALAQIVRDTWGDDVVVEIETRLLRVVP